MELSFDIRGNLKPYQLIEIDWATFVRTFVYSFDETSSRYEIFAQFERFIEEVKALLGESFELWINGSFTTLKENPKDIDVVFFISSHLITNELNRLFSLVKRDNNKKIDLYLLEVFPLEHSNYILYYSDTKYWLSQFSATKPNRRNEHFSKGIIKIKI